MHGSLLSQRQGKPTSLRSMPLLCGFFPMHQDFSVRESNRLVLDMSCVQRVDAVGLNIFVSNLLHALRDHEFKEFKFVAPGDASANRQMMSLDVPAILGRHRLVYHPELPFANELIQTASSHQSAQCLIEIQNFGPSRRDDQLHSARTKLKAFFKEHGGWSINQSQLILMLTEMIKNTLDHTEHSALLGITLELRNGLPWSLKFSYCEQGLGLSRTLRKKISEMPHLQSRGAKASFADLIHWALKAGNSTKKGNGINYGIGLTIITQSARLLGMTLCMIDAQSLFSLDQLPADPAHGSLRRAFSKVTGQGCFTYTGSKIYG